MKIIILDVGRGISRIDSTKSYPSALTMDREGHSVMDWLLSAFDVLEHQEIVLVGGHHIEKIIQNYPHLKFFYNPNWQTTGSLESLLLAEKELEGPCLISYSDVVYRPEVIKSLLTHTGKNHPIALATAKIDKEKFLEYDWKLLDTVQVENKTIVKVIPNFKNNESLDRLSVFGGLCYFSEKGVQILKKQIKQIREEGTNELFSGGEISKKASFIDVIQKIIDENVKVSSVDVTDKWAKIHNPLSLSRFVFGTKAQTLERLRTMVKNATILDQMRFTVEEWQTKKETILENIQNNITAPKIVIRSSALSEDTWSNSNAGFFHSEINVDKTSKDALQQGITNVIQSYHKVSEHSPLNEVFIQPHISNVKLSGVIFTSDLKYRSPYFFLNYTTHTDRTDAVTAGDSKTHTKVIYKYGEFKPKEKEFSKLIALAQELEELLNYDSLDIEFAITNQNEYFLFQVRPLVAHAHNQIVSNKDIQEELECTKKFVSNLLSPHPFLYGDATILGTMPDWNPAEIIGTTPRPLALSLYQYLITDTIWGKSRCAMGYNDTFPEPLIVSLVGRPYVDTRASFNSFLPKGLPANLSVKLVNHYLERLKSHPHLHDKIEFEIALTCYSFDFDFHAQRLKNDNFDLDEISLIKSSLFSLTDNAVREKNFSIEDELKKCSRLSEKRLQILNGLDGTPENLIRTIRYLLDCCLSGTLAFSNLARLSFIGSSFLKSLKRLGKLTNEEYDAFLMSIPTVASQITKDIEELNNGDLTLNLFLKVYGHLRPGTYDILSSRYDESPELYIPESISGGIKPEKKVKRLQQNPKEFFINKIGEIETLIEEHGFSFSANQLILFIIKSIKAREEAKFEFTKNLSDALMLLGRYAELIGLTKEDISFVPIQTFLNLATQSPSSANKLEIQRKASYNKKRYTITQAIQLPVILTSSNDIDHFQMPEVHPNFITSKMVCAEVIFLSLTSPDKFKSLQNKIVLIENADPGYDWIFSHKIVGLITKYGGIASHMSIRAAEFGLPSAIGCGDTIFERLVTASKIELNCATRQINALE